jgi:hypothetical protein
MHSTGTGVYETPLPENTAVLFIFLPLDRAK